MSNFDKHQSKDFDEKLRTVSELFLTMGRQAATQIAGSMQALIDGDVATADSIAQQDKTINELERQIDELVVLLVATRQPTANDLRLIMNISKGVIDLERIGDEAAKIARMTRHLSSNNDVLQEQLLDYQALSEQVRMMVVDAMVAFANNDARLAFDVVQADELIDKQYQSCIALLRQANGINQADLMDLFWVLRAIERIGDHARNLAELVIYTGSGTNISHQNLAVVQHAVDIASLPK